MRDAATQLDEFIGGLSHSRYNDDKVIAGLALLRHARRNTLDVVGGRD